ncbi:ABC transporter ATP-binding protein [Kineosporia rhizophila]|uniref:ABC transporter ATP-binding protein n=1 Tax=Kineosporia TaxID=49184 RepID=UPI001E3D339A|nr:ABC transporter ATP-binding protein [Kineosporia sp. NBRC 101677]MCE0539451.1 ABC transporter ATP-binding protein [Kineosporia rhizophila]
MPGSPASSSGSTGANGAAVEVSALVKRYGTKVAVDGASFTAAAGAVTAVLGLNGAGKTSTIECCEGLRRPDGGSVRVLGRDPVTDGAWLRPRVGVMLQDGGMPQAARAGDVLELAAAMYARPHPVKDLVETLDLGSRLRTPVRRLSGGERQRLALAVALVGRPDVAFLDEPTAGLDPQARIAVWELIGRLRRSGVAVVLTTHLLDEAERLADHVVLMAEGRVVAAGTPGELTGGTERTLSFGAPAGLDLTELAPLLSAGIAATEVRPGHYVVANRTPEAHLLPGDVAATTAWCARLGIMPEGLVLGRRSLEDVFLEIAARRSGAAQVVGVVGA